MSPGRLPVQLLVELGHDDARSDLVQVVGRGETLDRLVVHVALDVDLGVVAVRQRRRRLLEIGEAIAQRVDLTIDDVVADGRARHLDRQRVVALDADLGAHLDDGVELDVAGVLARGDVDLRRRDGVDVLGLNRLGVVVGQRVAQRLFAPDLAAEPRLQEPPRRLARAEAGHLHLVRELAEGRVDGPFEVGRRDRHVEANLVVFENFDGRRDGHGVAQSTYPDVHGFAMKMARERAAGRGRPLVAGERWSVVGPTQAPPWGGPPPGASGCTGSW